MTVGRSFATRLSMALLLPWLLACDSDSLFDATGGALTRTVQMVKSWNAIQTRAIASNASGQARGPLTALCETATPITGCSVTCTQSAGQYVSAAVLCDGQVAVSEFGVNNTSGLWVTQCGTRQVQGIQPHEPISGTIYYEAAQNRLRSEWRLLTTLFLLVTSDVDNVLKIAYGTAVDNRQLWVVGPSQFVRDISSPTWRFSCENIETVSTDLGFNQSSFLDVDKEDIALLLETEGLSIPETCESFRTLVDEIDCGVGYPTTP